MVSAGSETLWFESVSFGAAVDLSTPQKESYWGREISKADPRVDQGESWEGAKPPAPTNPKPCKPV